VIDGRRTTSLVVIGRCERATVAVRLRHASVWRDDRGGPSVRSHLGWCPVTRATIYGTVTVDGRTPALIGGVARDRVARGGHSGNCTPSVSFARGPENQNNMFISA